MENLKLTYRKNGDYFIPNLVLGNEEYKNYQIGKYGYLRLDYLRNYKKAEYELMRINCSLRKHIIEIDLQAKEKVKLLINQFKETENISESLKDTNPLEWVGKMNNGKVNIKLMKNYKVKLIKKFNIDFPITGNLEPAIGFFIFYFLLSISSNLSFNL